MRFFIRVCVCVRLLYIRSGICFLFEGKKKKEVRNQVFLFLSLSLSPMANRANNCPPTRRPAAAPPEKKKKSLFLLLLLLPIPPLSLSEKKGGSFTSPAQKKKRARIRRMIDFYRH